MRNVKLAVAFAALLAACSAEEPAAEDVVDDLPDGYVRVPHGSAHRDCVVALADRAAIDADGSVLEADGTRSKARVCPHPPGPLAREQVIDGDPAEVREPIDQPPPAISGWIASLYRATGVGIKTMVADFQVPPAPATGGDPLIYLFPALEPTPNQERIIQPVLQWGTSPAGGGHYWGIASWVGPIGGVYYHSNLVQVYQGNWIHGSMQGNSCSGDVCAKWTIKATNLGNGQSTTLVTTGNPYNFRLVFGGALEAYRVNGCSDYPATAFTPFNAIYATDVNGNLTEGPWTPWVGHDECGQWVAPNTYNIQIGYRTAPPVNHPPRGYLDVADCTSIRGWTQDQDMPHSAIDVHLYADGHYGQGGTFLGSVAANQYRADLCSAIGSCNHGFTFTTPSVYKNGVTHSVYAYGIDPATGAGMHLGDSPRTFNCAPPPPPPPPPCRTWNQTCNPFASECCAGLVCDDEATPHHFKCVPQ